MTPNDCTAGLYDQAAAEVESHADKLAQTAELNDATAMVLEPGPEKAYHRELSHQLRQAIACQRQAALHLRRAAVLSADEYVREHQPFQE